MADDPTAVAPAVSPKAPNPLVLLGLVVLVLVVAGAIPLALRLEGVALVGVAGAIAAPAIAVAVHLVLVRPAWGAAVAAQQAVAEAQGSAEAERRRHEFDQTMERALDLAETERDVLAVAGQALGKDTTRGPMEVLLADNAIGRLQHAMAVGPEGKGPGCPVGTVSGCPATRTGQTQVFRSSDDLDACPHLRNRASGPCSAVCIPVNLLGQFQGVLHATATNGAPPGAVAISRLETVARRTGSRLSMVRAVDKQNLRATTDPLTGLMNRATFDNRVRDLVRTLTPFTMALCDIDSFRQYNESHGHEAGDRALRLFAKTMQKTIRPSDFCARFGGEEFVIVFPDTSALDAAAALERVREALALSFADGVTRPFTASFGVADSNQGTSVNDIIATADVALMHAKQSGRNRVMVAGEETPEPVSDDEPS